MSASSSLAHYLKDVAFPAVVAATVLVIGESNNSAAARIMAAPEQQAQPDLRCSFL
jgi:hypothetical protein